MKALTLTQPWATLVAIGAKKIETRSWSTSYRGPLAIHAAKGLGPIGGQKGLIDLCLQEPFLSVLKAAGVIEGGIRKDRLPLGAIVAVCELTEIYRVPTPHLALTDQERAFGDYSFGRYAWLLTNVRALPEPIPVKGALGLWQPDTFTEMAIVRQQIRGIEL
jgi:hypothetical protein